MNKDGEEATEGGNLMVFSHSPPALSRVPHPNHNPSPSSSDLLLFTRSRVLVDSATRYCFSRSIKLGKISAPHTAVTEEIPPDYRSLRVQSECTQLCQSRKGGVGRGRGVGDKSAILLWGFWGLKVAVEFMLSDAVNFG